MRETRAVLGALFAILLVLAVPLSCSDADSPLAPQIDPEQVDPALHSVVIDGVRHGAGYCRPLDNCASCHGADLRGPNPSCYRCHGEKWNEPPCR